MSQSRKHEGSVKCLKTPPHSATTMGEEPIDVLGASPSNYQTKIGCMGSTFWAVGLVLFHVLHGRGIALRAYEGFSVTK